MASLLAVFGGFAGIPLAGAQFNDPPHRGNELPLTAIRLAEPGDEELAVVINANAVFGNHAGLFAGSRLSDPAGSYVSFRRQQPGWTPSLADYVRFQTTDGPHIRVYRFRLAPDEIASIAERLPEADGAAPLFCAAAVQNAIAGVGPFAGIPRTGWTSPANVASLLDQLLTAAGNAGRCELPDGTPCPPPAGVNSPAVAQGSP